MKPLTAQVLQIAMECYPAAKAGGLADVVGALPKYLNLQNYTSDVIIPRHRTQWIEAHTIELIWEATVDQLEYPIHYKVHQLNAQDAEELGYDLYFLDIPGLLDREDVYLQENGHGYHDEMQRHINFQVAVLHYLVHSEKLYNILHCHDHHTGLIPFMKSNCGMFESLKSVPVMFTIHNAKYQGLMPWKMRYLIPDFTFGEAGLLDWNNHINSLASALKCADLITTVSPHYLNEIQNESGDLKWLYQKERKKSVGILNGVDYEIWDPKVDPHVFYNLKKSVPRFKKVNKQEFMAKKGLELKDVPFFAFIGRLAYQKGADLLVPAVSQFIHEDNPGNFFFLGSGDQEVGQAIKDLANLFPGRVMSYIGYDESMAHQIYAAQDYLLMPSRFEPCGLNQMYTFRYGGLPIVRRTGGLVDTVIDASLEGGTGLTFEHADVYDLVNALRRAADMYMNFHPHFVKVQEFNTTLDYSWDNSIKQYIKYYNHLTHH